MFYDTNNVSASQSGHSPRRTLHPLASAPTSFFSLLFALLLLAPLLWVLSPVFGSDSAFAADNADVLASAQALSEGVSADSADELARVAPEIRPSENRLTQMGLEDGLVAHYEFEGNGHDSSGNGHDGTPTSGVGYADGMQGQSVLFDGTTEQRITVPDHEELDTNSQFTLSAWINPQQYRDNASYSHFIVSKWNTSPVAGEYILRVLAGAEAGRLNLTVANSEAGYVVDWLTAPGTDAIALNEWTHVAATFDESRMKLFINGVMVAEKESTSVTHTELTEYTNDQVTIGNSWTNQWQEYGFVGSIDDLRIYNRALSQAEIGQLAKDVLVTAILSFDNDLSSHAPAVIERFRQGTAANPSVQATLLVDQDGEGDTQVVEVANGVVTYRDGLPWLPGVHELDTANPDALAGFLTWARNEHPASRTLFALVGHGVGPAPEIEWPSQLAARSPLPALPQDRPMTPFDMTSGTYLSTPELGRALAEATDHGANPFDLVFFDQCFEGNLDVLYEVQQAGEVFVASPNYAWAAFAYDRYLPYFTLDATAEQMAQAILEQYQGQLDDTHPNAMFWLSADTISALGNSVSRLGDALQAELATNESNEQLILQASLNSQFADTTLLANDLELAPPDELIGLGSFASNLQARFPAGAVHNAAGTILSQLANVQSASRTGSPWLKPERSWAYTDKLTILAPLTRTLSAETVWRASMYTETAPLPAIWLPDPSIPITITTPMSYTVNGRWDNFLAAWYGPLTTSVDSLVHTSPPALIITDSESLTLTPQVTRDRVQFSWTASTHADAVEYAIYAQQPSGAWSIAATIPLTETVYTHSDLPAGEYSYFVVARNAQEEVVGLSDHVMVEVDMISLLMPEDATAQVGTQIQLPITVTQDLTGWEVYSYEFTLQFDPNVLIETVGISKNGTMSQNWFVSPPNISSGQIRIAAYGTQPLAGDGVLLNVQFTVTDTVGAETDLQFSDFMFNEGSPMADVQVGHVTIIPAPMRISGSVSYAHNNKPLSAVTMTLDGPAQMIDLTDNNSQYEFESRPLGEYTVTPSKEGDLQDAISALDAAWILQYAAGTRTFNADQERACDVSRDGTCTAFDASLIARDLVSLPTSNNRTGEWGFDPATRSYQHQLEEIFSNQTYRAYLYGDVTGNWGNAPTQRRSAAQNGVIVTLPALPTTIKPGAEINIPLEVSDVTGLQILGYEGQLTYDPTVLELKSVSQANSLSAEWAVVSNDTQAGRLQLVAYGVTPLSGEGALLTFTFTALANADQQSPPAFEQFRFNEGEPAAKVVGGSFGTYLYLPIMID